MKKYDWKKEDKLVRWLLTHYGLYDKRARHMIIDEAERIAAEMQNQFRHEDYPPPPRRLTLRAFDGFFKFHYPMQLSFQSLTRTEAKVITGHKLITAFNKTRFYRDFIENVDGYELTHAAGIIYLWPYQQDVGKSIVVHNSLSIDTRIPGTHLVYTDAYHTIAVEPLDAMVVSLDAIHPPETWHAQAKKGGYMTQLNS